MVNKSNSSQATRAENRTLIVQPEAVEGMAEGFYQLARLLALTLGPQQGLVVNARSGRGDPEFLSDSAVIAKRVVQLPGRTEDMGAMLLRGMVADLDNHYGDGAATAAVLAEAMVRSGAKMLAAGANPMSLRAGIERGTDAAAAELARMARPLAGQEAITRLASIATGDPALGAVLGEMFDLMGPHAAVVIQDFYAPHLEREYISGGRWTGRPAAREFLPPGQPEVAYEDALILVANQEIEAIEHIRPVLELAANRRPRQPLVILAKNVKGAALTTLLMNVKRGTLEAVALIPAGNLFRLEEDLSDMALLSGARMIDPSAGDTLERFTEAGLGRAQRVFFTQTEITIVGGAGEQAALQKRVSEVRARIRQVKRGDPEWEKLRLRAARLSGGIGILKLGAIHDKERNLRKEITRKAMRMISAALEEGVLPGGGSAYLACRDAVRAQRSACANEDEAFGVEIVATALEAPFRQIVQNAGCVPPAVALDRVERRGPGFGYDVAGGQIVDMAQAGILDGAGVLVGALHAAASAATMLLTTAVVVLKK